MKATSSENIPVKKSEETLKIEDDDQFYPIQIVVLLDGPSPVGKTNKLPGSPLFSFVPYTIIGFPSSNLSGSQYVSRWGLTVALNMLVTTVSAIIYAKSPDKKLNKSEPLVFIENSPFAISSFISTLYLSEKITKMEKKIFDDYYDFLLPLVLSKIDGIFIVQNSKNLISISQSCDFPVWICEPIYYHDLPVFNTFLQLDTLLDSNIKHIKH